MIKPKLEKDSLTIPAKQIPAFRAFAAKRNGTFRNVLIKCWGGLGDQICAEPAIRFASKIFPLDTFKISVATIHPELFLHLPVTLIDLKKVTPNYEEYFVFETIQTPESLLWDFQNHMLTHPVDFSSLAMWRMQLPIEDREIKLPDFPMTEQVTEALNVKNPIVVHAGKHWQSKTFPKTWWDDTIDALFFHGFTPILIGKTDSNGDHGGTGFVDVDAEGCIDLRDKLSLKEFLTICKNCKVILSNDSSPIHAAAAGEGLICFVSSIKRPDYLKHWRKNSFGHKTLNLEEDGMWNYTPLMTEQDEEIKLETIPEEIMGKILPEPGKLAETIKKQVGLYDA